MKKRILTCLLVLLFTGMAVRPVQAAGEHLVDSAGLLSQTEADTLRTQLEEISNRQDVDIVVVTVTSTDGQDIQYYAADYYDYNGYRPDGILMMLDMGTRSWFVCTTGYGITAVTDAGLRWMQDRFLPYLSSGDYAAAFEQYAKDCDDYITQARNGRPVDVYLDDNTDTNTGKMPFSWVRRTVVALLIGFLVALISTGVMRGQLKSVRQKTSAANYVRPNSMDLQGHEDLFLYSNVTRTARPKETSDRSGGGGGGGGSSTFTSSSGTSHGGGGGHF